MDQLFTDLRCAQGVSDCRRNLGYRWLVRPSRRVHRDPFGSFGLGEPLFANGRHIGKQSRTLRSRSGDDADLSCAMQIDEIGKRVNCRHYLPTDENRQVHMNLLLEQKKEALRLAD
jgi:hypothetical protein